MSDQHWVRGENAQGVKAWLSGVVSTSAIVGAAYQPDATAVLCPPGFCYAYTLAKINDAWLWVNDGDQQDAKQAFIARDYPEGTTLDVNY